MSGAAYTSLLQNCLGSGIDFDALLLGRVNILQQQCKDDTSENIISTLHEAHVITVLCLPRKQLFHANDGTVDGKSLCQWLQYAPPGTLEGLHLLGWLPYRPKHQRSGKFGPKIIEKVSRSFLQQRNGLHHMLAAHLQASGMALPSDPAVAPMLFAQLIADQPPAHRPDPLLGVDVTVSQITRAHPHHDGDGGASSAAPLQLRPCPIEIKSMRAVGRQSAYGGPKPHLGPGLTYMPDQALVAAEQHGHIQVDILRQGYTSGLRALDMALTQLHEAAGEVQSLEQHVKDMQPVP